MNLPGTTNEKERLHLPQHRHSKRRRDAASTSSVLLSPMHVKRPRAPCPNDVVGPSSSSPSSNQSARDHRSGILHDAAAVPSSLSSPSLPPPSPHAPEMGTRATTTCSKSCDATSPPRCANGAVVGQPLFSRKSPDDTSHHHNVPLTKFMRLSSVSAAPLLPSSTSSPSRLVHPFRANFNDHFETSREAILDLMPVVDELRHLLRPSTQERFTIYDPYYCAGAIVHTWREVGVTRVLHENRDFYADVAHGTVPGPYDMLVTNPPFSDDHIWRLLEFLATQSPSKPWAFVAPDYIAAKPPYRAWIRKYFNPTPAPPPPPPSSSSRRGGSKTCGEGGKRTLAATIAGRIPSIACTFPPFLLAEEVGGEKEGVEEIKNSLATTGDTLSAPPRSASTTTTSSSSSLIGPEPFYLVPRTRYDYQHPLGVGHEHSHFKSMWYVWAGRHTNEVLRGVTVALSRRGPSVMPYRTTRQSGDATAKGTGGGAPVAVVHGLDALVEGHHVSAMEKRANPQRRHRPNASK